MIHTIGYKPKKIPFIPYSGFDGDNLDKRTDKAPWYTGWSANINPKTTVTGYTLLECLNNFIQPPKRLPDAPLRKNIVCFLPCSLGANFLTSNISLLH